jgi:hypothetical protein
MTLTRLILGEFEDFAPSRYPIAPDAIEIGDQRIDLLGADQSLRLTDIGEFVKSIVDRRVGAAPAASPSLRAKNLDASGR